jgi:hypothetical protein
MNDKDYTDLLMELFELLDKIGATEIKKDLTNIINEGKTEIIYSEHNTKKRILDETRIKKGEIKSQKREYTEREAFEIAFNYIKKIILETPKYADVISNTFSNEKSEINWKTDYNIKTEEIKDDRDFDLNNIKFPESEQEKAQKIIQEIQEQMEDEYADIN